MYTCSTKSLNTYRHAMAGAMVTGVLVLVWCVLVAHSVAMVGSE